jgi:hypothetical protein
MENQIKIAQTNFELFGVVCTLKLPVATHIRYTLIMIKPIKNQLRRYVLSTFQNICFRFSDNTKQFR